MIIKDWLDAHPDKGDIISLAIDFAEWKRKARDEALRAAYGNFEEWSKVIQMSLLDWFNLFIEQYKHES